MADENKTTREKKIEAALRRLLIFRSIVNDDADGIRCLVSGDIDGLLVAYFNGPAWDEAEEALFDD